jgi:predicted DCC family thiol-disulfide oxidoreductase YuxK
MENPDRDSAAAAPALTVFYDGACPLCAREIGAYRRMPGAEAVCWIDARQVDAAALGEGLTRGAALARFHVRAGDGSLLSGGAAFLRLWAALPGTRWLAAIASRPPVSWILEPAYRISLRLRPWLARLVAGRV